jgi:hypothetical protein
MALYKRVYPRWSETWTGQAGTATIVEEDAMEE